MFRHMLTLVFVVGMVGSSTVPSAGQNFDSSCEATVKCVCEGPLHTRVVDCPTDVYPPFFHPSAAEWGTVALDCSHELTHDTAGLCEDLNYKCKWWYGEHKNCLLTLPLFVTPSGPPPCGDTFPACNGTCPESFQVCEDTGAGSCACVEG